MKNYFILKVYDCHDNEIHKDITSDGKNYIHFNSPKQAEKFLWENILSYKQYSIIKIIKK